MKAEAKTKQTLKNVLVIALGVVILALGVRLTMTAFTANDFLKAVNTTDKTENLFTSDLLVGYANEPSAETLDRDHQSKELSSLSESVSFDFNIYNYLLNDTAAVNTKDVFYKLEISAVPVSVRAAASNDVAGSEYSIQQQGGETKSFGMDGSVSFDRLSLAGNAANSHHFIVTLPSDDIGKVAFVIKATVLEPKGTTLNCLAAKIVTSAASEVTTYAITGDLVATAGEFKDDVAYNYRITVTGEGQQVKLAWPDTVTLEPFFDSKYHLNVDGSGEPTREGNSVTFYLSAGTHTINFYQANGPSGIPSNKSAFEKQFSVAGVSS